MVNTKQKDFAGIFIRLTLIILLFVLICPDIEAKKSRKKSKTKKLGLDITYTLSSLYDSNILSYSDKYRERFENSEDAGRFHINTFDDIYFNNALSLKLKYKVFGKLNTALSAKISSKNYMNNSIKDWIIADVGLQQDISSKTKMRLGYNLIPDYYVRHYLDKDQVSIVNERSDAYKPFSFAKENLNAWIEHEVFDGTSLRLSYSYIRYFHNEHFTEYDSKNSELAFQVKQELSRKLDLYIGYRLTNSDAQAYDEAGETASISDDADASFDGERFILGGSFDLPRINNRSNSVDFRLQYYYYFFDTDNGPGFDPLHAGRKDFNFRFQFRYKYSLSSRIKLSAVYQWNMRRAESAYEDNSGYISNEKDFDQHRIGIEFSYLFKL